MTTTGRSLIAAARSARARRDGDQSLTALLIGTALALALVAPSANAQTDWNKIGRGFGDAYIEGEEAAARRRAAEQEAQLRELEIRRRKAELEAAEEARNRARNTKPPTAPPSPREGGTDLSPLGIGPKKPGEMPAMGGKICGIWLHFHKQAASESAAEAEFRNQLQYWQMGYLRGMADQWAFTSKAPNPLLYAASHDEFIEWTTSYCRVHIQENMSNAALAYLTRLVEVGDQQRDRQKPNARQ